MKGTQDSLSLWTYVSGIDDNGNLIFDYSDPARAHSDSIIMVQRCAPIQPFNNRLLNITLLPSENKNGKLRLLENRELLKQFAYVDFKSDTDFRNIACVAHGLAVFHYNDDNTWSLSLHRKMVVHAVPEYDSRYKREFSYHKFTEWLEDNPEGTLEDYLEAHKDDLLEVGAEPEEVDVIPKSEEKHQPEVAEQKPQGINTDPYFKQYRGDGITEFERVNDAVTAEMEAPANTVSKPSILSTVIQPVEEDQEPQKPATSDATGSTVNTTNVTQVTNTVNSEIQNFNQHHDEQQTQVVNEGGMVVNESYTDVHESNVSNTTNNQSTEVNSQASHTSIAGTSVDGHNVTTNEGSTYNKSEGTYNKSESTKSVVSTAKSVLNDVRNAISHIAEVILNSRSESSESQTVNRSESNTSNVSVTSSQVNNVTNSESVHTESTTEHTESTHTSESTTDTKAEKVSLLDRIKLAIYEKAVQLSEKYDLSYVSVPNEASVLNSRTSEVRESVATPVDTDAAQDLSDPDVQLRKAVIRNPADVSRPIPNKVTVMDQVFNLDKKTDNSFAEMISGLALVYTYVNHSVQKAKERTAESHRALNKSLDKKFDGLKSWFNTRKITEILKWLAGGLLLIVFWPVIKKGFGWLIDQVKSSPLFKSISEWFTTHFPNLSNILSNIVGVLQVIPDTITTIHDWIFGEGTTTLQNIMQTGQAIMSSLKAIWDWCVNIGKNIMDVWTHATGKGQVSEEQFNQYYSNFTDQWSVIERRNNAAAKDGATPWTDEHGLNWHIDREEFVRLTNPTQSDAAQQERRDEGSFVQGMQDVGETMKRGAYAVGSFIDTATDATAHVVGGALGYAPDEIGNWRWLTPMMDAVEGHHASMANKAVGLAQPIQSALKGVEPLHPMTNEEVTQGIQNIDMSQVAANANEYFQNGGALGVVGQQTFGAINQEDVPKQPNNTAAVVTSTRVTTHVTSFNMRTPSSYAQQATH